MSGLNAILLVTYAKHERYIDHCIETINTLWPEHPITWVLSDYGDFSYPNSVIVNSPHWVEIVNKGLVDLVDKKHLNKEDYVLLLIEDHVPTQAIHDGLIKKLANHMRVENMQYLNLSGHGKGEWIGQVNGLDLYELQNHFPYYSALHPAIWRVQHLLDVTSLAISRAILDPWSFEKVQDHQIRHFVSDRFWPSTFSGFLKGGRVNINAVKEMNESSLKGLKRKLIMDWILTTPNWLFKRLLRKVKRSFQKDTNH